MSQRLTPSSGLLFAILGFGLLISVSAARGQANAKKTASPPAFWYRARQIVVQHQGSDGRRKHRSLKSARRRARRLRALLSEGMDFAKLAQQSSDGPYKKEGGQIPRCFRLDNLVGELPEQLWRLPLGQLSKPIQSRYGLLILKRQNVDQWALQQILIAWKGAKRSPETVTRSREEAAALARSLLKKLAAGADFGELASEHSDGPELERDGHMGIVAAPLIDPKVAKALGGLKDSETSAEPLETAFGFLLLRRCRMQTAAVSHILFTHAESRDSDSTQTLEEVRKQAERRLKALLKQPGEFFQKGPQLTRAQRLFLGVVPRFGPQMPAAIQQAVFETKAGQITPRLVETEHGFHILFRHPS